MRISDWSSHVCSSDVHAGVAIAGLETIWTFAVLQSLMMACFGLSSSNFGAMAMEHMGSLAGTAASVQGARSEEHTSELQSLMRISYAVFCLKKKQRKRHITN